MVMVESAWELFCATGAPEFYLLYREALERQEAEMTA